jgi:hypothetical protein
MSKSSNKAQIYRLKPLGQFSLFNRKAVFELKYELNYIRLFLKKNDDEQKKRV